MILLALCSSFAHAPKIVFCKLEIKTQENGIIVSPLFDVLFCFLVHFLCNSPQLTKYPCISCVEQLNKVYTLDCKNVDTLTMRSQ